MPSFPVPEGPRSKLVMSKRRASLVVNLDSNPRRLPCLVLDSSKEVINLPLILPTQDSVDLGRASGLGPA